MYNFVVALKMICSRNRIDVLKLRDEGYMTCTSVVLRMALSMVKVPSRRTSKDLCVFGVRQLLQKYDLFEQLTSDRDNCLFVEVRHICMLGTGADVEGRKAHTTNCKKQEGGLC